MSAGILARTERLVPVVIRAFVRHVPPRGRGIRLAQAWTALRPPDEVPYISREPGGARLRCDLRDHLSRVVYYRGWMDPALESWMRRWLRPGDVYVDVGAHIGYLSALAARAVGPEGRVVAFEPSPESWQRLRDAFDPSDFPQVDPVNAAVASETGEASLFTAAGDWEHQAYRNSLHPAPGLRHLATVRTVSLDGMFPDDRLRLLKIDVEGGEQAVLAGAESLLRSGRCDALVIELNPDALARAGSSVPEIVTYLETMGFLAHRFRTDGSVERWQPVDVQGEFCDAVFLPAGGGPPLR